MFPCFLLPRKVICLILKSHKTCQSLKIAIIKEKKPKHKPDYSSKFFLDFFLFVFGFAPPYSTNGDMGIYSTKYKYIFSYMKEFKHLNQL